MRIATQVTANYTRGYICVSLECLNIKKYNSIKLLKLLKYIKTLVSLLLTFNISRTHSRTIRNPKDRTKKNMYIQYHKREINLHKSRAVFTKAASDKVTMYQRKKKKMPRNKSFSNLYRRPTIKRQFS